LLYGHDIDETMPVSRSRLVDRQAPAHRRRLHRSARSCANWPKARRGRRRHQAGRAPARDGTVVTDMVGRRIGVITSGGFGPTANGPIAMAYVETASAAPGTPVLLIVRDKPMPAKVASLPFVPHHYKR
jgi:aminomethyltransferase